MGSSRKLPSSTAIVSIGHSDHGFCVEEVIFSGEQCRERQLTLKRLSCKFYHFLSLVS